ncbi:hypothetical protein BC834DRAFT_965762 [Gloeopeniophorella convolvens]|nr:hypothetical protein BC834DRAFT_965762 [Gloeopeniophorella convolvens]
MRLLPTATTFVALLGLCVPSLLANTEIINFSAGQSLPASPAPASVPRNWPTLATLRAGANELIREVVPAPRGTVRDALCALAEQSEEGETEHRCAHDLWLGLDLGEPWGRYDRFTLRVSWPASHPADIALNVHPTSSRHLLARVRVTNEGVRAPGDTRPPQAVPLVVVLEPLLLGVLPASVLPVLLFLLPVLGVAGTVVLPRVQKMVGRLTQEARRELQAAVSPDDTKGGGKRL